MGCRVRAVECCAHVCMTWWRLEYTCFSSPTPCFSLVAMARHPIQLGEGPWRSRGIHGNEHHLGKPGMKTGTKRNVEAGAVTALHKLGSSAPRPVLLDASGFAIKSTHVAARHDDSSAKRHLFPLGIHSLFTRFATRPLMAGRGVRAGRPRCSGRERRGRGGCVWRGRGSPCARPD